jgi:Spt5 transcription elongation factor, acidic N-terminal
MSNRSTMEAVGRFFDLEAQVGEEEEEEEEDDEDEMRMSSPQTLVTLLTYFDPPGDFIINSAHQEEEEVDATHSTFAAVDSSPEQLQRIAQEYDARAAQEHPRDDLDNDSIHPVHPNSSIYRKLTIDAYNYDQASGDADLWIFNVPVNVTRPQMYIYF